MTDLYEQSPSSRERRQLRTGTRLVLILLVGPIVGAIIASVAGWTNWCFWEAIGKPKGADEWFSLDMLALAVIWGPIHGAVAGLIAARELTSMVQDQRIRDAALGAVGGAVVGEILIQGVSVPIKVHCAKYWWIWLLLTPVALASAAILGAFTVLHLRRRGRAS